VNAAAVHGYTACTMNLEGDPIELQARLDSLPEGHPDRPMVLNELAWAVRMNDMQRAFDLVQQALREAEVLEDERALGWGWRAMAFFNLLSPDLDETLARARRALGHFEAVNDDLGRAVIWDLMATIHEILGDYSVAMQYAIDAQETHRQLGYERGVAWALSSIGGILAASGDLDGAQRHFEEALEIFERLDYPIGISRLRGRLGRMYLDRGELEKARGYLARDQAMWAERDFPVFHAGALANLGELHEALGELERARELYEEARRIAPEPLKVSLGMTTSLALGRLMYKQGDHARAVGVLNEIADGAAAARVAPLESKARALLADIYEEKGDTAGALRELRRHLALRERVLSAEHRTKLKHLELKKEVESSRKDAEIHRLRYVELKEAQERVVAAEQLAVLGKLAAGIAHEMNSPLGVVRNSVATMERAALRLSGVVGDSPDVRHLIGALRTSSDLTHPAIERLSGIAASLRRFAHLDGADEQEVNVVEGLEGALTLLAPTVDGSVRLVKSIEPVRPVWGHPGQLNQVFLTLLGHAADAARGVGGTVRVSTGTEADDIVVRIENDCENMTVEEVAQLFDVHFGQQGTRVRFRLGMGAAATTVRQYNGAIAAELVAPGRCVITVRLPAARQ
jgi:signal transduction histidine kinase